MEQQRQHILQLICEDIQRNIVAIHQSIATMETCDQIEEAMEETTDVSHLHFLIAGYKNHLTTMQSDLSRWLQMANKQQTTPVPICQHQWVDDLIDIDPDRSMRIWYCSCCHATKK